jgi:rhodanese-related sulfurtransferase
MVGTLKVSSAQLVADARGKIREVAATDAIDMMGREDVLMVDLRDIRERERGGFIPRSFHCPRGMTEFWVDPESPYYKDVFGRDVTFLFYCASGWRSAITVFAVQQMGLEKVAHITEGFNSWKEAGGPVERYS